MRRINKIKLNYIYSTKSISSSENIYIYNEDNEVVYESKTPKIINYLFFTSFDTKSSYSFVTSSGKISTSYGNQNSGENFSSLYIRFSILLFVLVFII